MKTRFRGALLSVLFFVLLIMAGALGAAATEEKAGAGTTEEPVVVVVKPMVALTAVPGSERSVLSLSASRVDHPRCTATQDSPAKALSADAQAPAATLGPPSGDPCTDCWLGCMEEYRQCRRPCGANWSCQDACVTAVIQCEQSCPRP